MQSRTGTTGEDRLRARATTVLAVLLLVSSVFVWWASEREIGFYRVAPGSVIDTGPLVMVEEGRAHPADGTVLLTTVSFGKATLLEAIAGWLDPTVDVVRESVIAPDVDEDELREINLGMMQDSKQAAIAVAFEALGFDAVTGSGAEVLEVLEGTPAASLLEAGDVIVAVDGQPTMVHIDAVQALGSKRPGDRVVIGIEPAGGGPRRDIEAVLAEHPEEAGRPFLGVTLGTNGLDLALPFEVDVRSEQIGGPSAGLAFTLEIIDVLTEGELTGGRIVAATGTIELDGSVGAVGGVAQKTAVVRASGADVFLVPAGEVEIAERHAGDDLAIVPIETLDDALEALAELGGNGLALPPLEADDEVR
jgi:PDZ domain-containing protein